MAATFGTSRPEAVIGQWECGYPPLRSMRPFEAAMERGPLSGECGRLDSWPLQAALWQKFDAARALATYSDRSRHSDPACRDRAQSDTGFDVFEF